MTRWATAITCAEHESHWPHSGSPSRQGADGVSHFAETVSDEMQVTWPDGRATPSPPFEVVRASGYSNGVVVLRVSGELDLSTACPLAKHLRHHLEANPRGIDFVVDLSKLSFLGARGIAALIDAAREADLRGCRFAIIGCRPNVARILDIAGAREVLNVLPLDP